MYIPAPIVGYICDKYKKDKKKKKNSEDSLCVILQQERPPNPLTVFSLPLGIAFLFVSYTMSELPSELQGRNGENCNHSILFTIRIPCLFYGSNFSQVNWVDTISHPLDAPKAGIRELETIQRSTPSPKQICFQGHGNQRAICYLFMACQLWLSW